MKRGGSTDSLARSGNNGNRIHNVSSFAGGSGKRVAFLCSPFRMPPQAFAWYLRSQVDEQYTADQTKTG